MLSPLDADIDGAVRIPYLPEWESLLRTYIKKDTSKIDFEDGIAFTSTFIEQAKLCEIIYPIASQSFRTRAAESNDATSNKSIHVAMAKWLDGLPAKLQWNQWMRDQVPAYVLHLQLVLIFFLLSFRGSVVMHHSFFYHTLIILLHRPPRQSFRSHLASIPEDLEICDRSLSSILQLLKVYYRYYGFAQLPVTFVHTAATATSIILLKRWLHRNDADETAAQLNQISRVVDGLALSWSVAKHIQVVIREAGVTDDRGSVVMEAPPGFDWDSAMGFDIDDFTRCYSE